MLHTLGTYIKHNLLGLGVACAVVCFFIETLLFHTNHFPLTAAATVLVFIAAGYEKHYARRLKELELKKRGLTFADTLNIGFVKNWEILRKKGIYKFCFVDGGLMLGLIIVLPLALIGMLALSDLNSLFFNPGRLLWYIADCCLVGYVIGAVTYLTRWVRNEKRFIRLTDPFAYRSAGS